MNEAGPDEPEDDESDLPRIQRVLLPDVPDWDPESESETLRRRGEQKRAERARPTKPPSRDDKRFGLVQGLVIAYALIGPMIAGFLVGLYLDWGTPATIGRGVGTMAGLAVGLGLAIFIANRYFAKDES